MDVARSVMASLIAKVYSVSSTKPDGTKNDESDFQSADEHQLDDLSRTNTGARFLRHGQRGIQIVAWHLDNVDEHGPEDHGEQERLDRPLSQARGVARFQSG